MTTDGGGQSDQHPDDGVAVGGPSLAIGGWVDDLEAILSDAALIPLGVLTDDEVVAWQERLSRLPRGLREHVLEEQSRSALALAGVLPSASPSPDLRRRIVSSVREAASPDPVPVGRTDADEPDAARRGRISMLWRPVAVGLAASLAVLAGVQVSVFNELVSRPEPSTFDALQSALGAKRARDLLLSPHVTRVAFVAAEPAPTIAAAPDGEDFAGAGVPSAMLVSHPDWSTAVVCVQGLVSDPAVSYRIAVVRGVGADRRFEDLATFEPSGVMSMVDLDSGVLAGLRAEGPEVVRIAVVVSAAGMDESPRMLLVATLS